MDRINADPELNFEALWKIYDRNYGSFIPKQIDWDLLYRVYRPKVSSQTTDDQLFEIMTRLLEHLNDNHVKLQSQQPPRFFRSGILGSLNRDEEGRHIPIGYNIPDFSLSLVKEKYLKGKFEERLPGSKLAAYFGGSFPLYTFARIAEGIGYFHIRNFDDEEKTALIADEIVSEFQSAKGVIIDVRGNGGGWDPVAKAISDRFADTRRLYMVTRIRNGPQHDDFTSPRFWHTEPKGPRQFTKPVVLLTHRWTISAGDCFVLAMRALPHVTNLGEATSGAYSDEYWDKLPNGWDVCIANKLYLDNEGRCWEGMGTLPDIRAVNTKDDIREGRDRVLETAIEMIQAGPVKLSDRPSSLQTRESLADSLGKALETVSLEAAVRLFKESKKGNPETYYIDREEMEILGQRFLSQNKIARALAVYKLNAEEHPLDYHVYQSLAILYERSGNKELAATNYRKSCELNPQNLPGERKDYEKAQEVIGQ
jgi:C-terminal processing protease CtpA/Prc